MLCGWEGNRRSGIALALRHRLCMWYKNCGLSGLRKGDEYTAYTKEYGTVHLYFYESYSY